MSALTYYVLVDCPQCGTEFHQGPHLTLLVHNGRPVVMAAELAESRVDCPECGSAIFFGELDSIVEDAP